MQPTTGASAPEPSRLGLGLAIAWLVVTVLACMGNLALVFTPEVAVNVSLVTVPFFASGWGAVIAATLARKRAPREALVAPLIGAGLGLVVGVIAIGVTCAILWPDFG